jgi:hypothetical protein
MSVFDFAHFGSTLAVRGFTRLLKSTVNQQTHRFFPTGKGVRFVGKLGGKGFDTNHRIVGTKTDEISFYGHATDRSLSLEQPGSGSHPTSPPIGHIHGTWTGETTITTSERRLKKNIRDLAESLTDRSGYGSNMHQAILRELRPVSFKYRKGTDSKDSHTRFGFLADELLRTLPEITRSMEGGDRPKDEQLLGVTENDLLAVLTTVLQGLAKDMAEITPRLQDIEQRVQQRKRWKRAKQAERAQAETASMGFQRPRRMV